MSCFCQRCGDPYNVDLSVPDDIWVQISPKGNETGMLCPTCICHMIAIKGLGDVNAVIHGGNTMKHVLFETADKDVPKSIQDGNGEVALGLCRVCGGAECSLTTDCPGENMTTEQADLICAAELDYKDGQWKEL